MQAAIATLFGKELDDVPNFIEHGEDWSTVFFNYAMSEGYRFEATLYNFDAHPDINRDGNRFDELKDYEGVNGLFYAAVFSPGFYHPDQKSPVKHAVLVDKELNIVHDPNPNYEGIEKYPRADEIGCGGITEVFILEPYNEETESS